ncbi:MAG: hypothetical protein K6E12_03260 [Saccharofermentans sp.]|nr:hypothetical protein [Saccharofermentans sp.]
MKITGKQVLTVLTVMALIPVMCACSLGKKKAVIEAAYSFGEALKDGEAGKILGMTDGLDREFKKSFKDLMNPDNYTEEELVYADHMMRSIKVVIDEESVVVDKETAKIDMEFKVADYESLQGGDYSDIDAVASAVDSASERTIKVTAELALIEKEWYITNFSDPGFQDLYSFLGNMPVIGRGALLETAETVALAVVLDNETMLYDICASVSDSDTIDLPSYLSKLFSNENFTDEAGKFFYSAVVDSMTYMIDESTLQIDSQKGSVVIIIDMADYEQLAGITFDDTSDIRPAVEALPVKTYEFTCEFIRVGTDWFVINLDSEEFAEFLKYKNFSISMNSIDGTYSSTLDITDKFIAYVESEYGIAMPSDLEGRIYITSTLVLSNGSYEVTIDRDAFVANIKTFVENNIDKILMNTLGTTSSYSLDLMAKVAGYDDYADMRQSILDDVITNVESINTSGLDSSGTFKFKGSEITLTSSTGDIMNGTIDSFGAITITSPVNDPDAKKLLGSDTVTMTFKKA